MSQSSDNKAAIDLVTHFGSIYKVYTLVYKRSLKGDWIIIWRKRNVSNKQLYDNCMIKEGPRFDYTFLLYIIMKVVIW